MKNVIDTKRADGLILALVWLCASNPTWDDALLEGEMLHTNQTVQSLALQIDVSFLAPACC